MNVSTERGTLKVKAIYAESSRVSSSSGRIQLGHVHGEQQQQQQQHLPFLFSKPPILDLPVNPLDHPKDCSLKQQQYECVMLLKCSSSGYS